VDLVGEAIVKLFDKKCSNNAIYHVFNPIFFNLSNYMQSDKNVHLLPVTEFIRYIISDLENTANIDLILRFLLAHGWMGMEGFYQFSKRTYLQNRTQHILKCVNFEWKAIENKQFAIYLRHILNT
jgi:hypothetical protein